MGGVCCTRRHSLRQDAATAGPRVPEAWTRGTPWPWAATGPRGLPPLFPGPPGWTSNPALFLNSLGPRFQALAFLGQLAGNQYETDSRWSRLKPLYDAAGGEDSSRPWTEHRRNFAAAGLCLEDTNGAAARDPSLSLPELVRARLEYSLLLDFAPTSPPPPRKCDGCGKPAVAQCACGETYCGRVCQTDSWNGHRDTCEAAQENMEMGIMLTKLWWKQLGLRVD